MEIRLSREHIELNFDLGWGPLGWHMGDMPSIEGDRVGGVRKTQEISKGSFLSHTHQNIHNGKSGYLGGTLS